MKRFLSIFLAVIIALSLFACGKPPEMSDAVYDLGCKALQITDDYIAGKVTGEVAARNVKAYSKQCGTICNKGASTKDQIVDAQLGSLEIVVSASILRDSYFTQVLSKRDELAKTLGK